MGLVWGKEALPQCCGVRRGRIGLRGAQTHAQRTPPVSTELRCRPPAFAFERGDGGRSPTVFGPIRVPLPMMDICVSSRPRPGP